MIKMGFRGYADLWLRHNPQGPRARLSKEEYEGRALRKGEVAVWSILRDWIKAQITAIEVGMLTFEGAFLSQIILSGGRTVFEVVQKEGMLQIAAA